MKVVPEVAMRSMMNPNVELELSYATLATITVLAVFYIAIASVGIRTFQKCSKIQDSQKWKNLKMFLSHTLTMAITVVLTLFVTKLFKSEAGAFGMIFGVTGFIASIITISLTRECKDVADKSAFNFAVFSTVGNGILMMASIFMMLNKRGKFDKMKARARARGTPYTSINKQTTPTGGRVTTTTQPFIGPMQESFYK